MTPKGTVIMNCTYCGATDNIPSCVGFRREHPTIWLASVWLYENGYRRTAAALGLICGIADAEPEPETVTLCASGLAGGRQCDNEAFAVIMSPSGMLDVAVCPECAVRPEYRGWTIRALGQEN